MQRGHEIKVLDKGYVRLVDYMGSDEAIVEAARMSTGRGFVSWEPYKRCRRCDAITHLDVSSTVDETVMSRCEKEKIVCDWQEFPRGDLGLLETMYKNKHSTPFEFGTIHIEVMAPLMVYREWHRHRTWSYSEFSARYSQMPDLHYVPSMERMLASQQSKTNKQGSQDGLDEYVAEVERQNFIHEQREIYDGYEARLEKGVAKEVARLNTSVSRYSKMRGIVNLRNALAFLILRKAPAAQWEIRQYADAFGEIVKSIWPRTYALFEEHDLHGIHLSRTEAAQLVEWVKTHPMRDDVHTTSLLKKLGAKK